MTASYDKTGALVLLPPIRGGRLADKGLRAWLAQSELSRVSGPIQPLDWVLQEMGHDCPQQGLAAMRMWGQTGDRPTNWMAAADPVHLEPQLDRLRLHALRRQGVPAADMRLIVDYLQDKLGDDGNLGFVRMGSYGYLSSKTPLATARVPAFAVDQCDPGEHLPGGDDTALHRNVLSEIEMALHEHPVNLEREANGLMPINSLWLWGGGVAPPEDARPQPPLFTDDALLTGYWLSGKGVAEPWPGNLAECLEIAAAGLVAVTPEFADDAAALESLLGELREALRQDRLSSLVLLSRDGIRAEIRRSHARRIWRRNSELLD